MDKFHSRILVTAFKPFRGELINPTEQILLLLKQDQILAEFFEFMVLPVEFDKSFKLISEMVVSNHFSNIMMLGQAGGRKKISLERFALNWIETEFPDEAGVSPQRGLIDGSQPHCMRTQFDIENLMNQLRELYSCEVEVSLSAGGYVCNHLYFKVLTQLDPSALFIHTPWCELQNKASEPIMQLSGQAEIIKKILLIALESNRIKQPI